MRKEHRPLHLLVAEDNLINAKVLGLFNKFGHTHDHVLNGLEACEAVKAEQYDAILMDMQMPEMDGLEATRHIRTREEEHGTKPSPIIALTANAMGEDEQRCRDAGMNDFVPKPVTSEALTAAFARLE